MTHNPILLNNLSLEFPHKTCFTNFTCIINHGSRIAIIGRNGSGKTSLLQMMRNITTNLKVGYVPQIVDEYTNLSGGQRFNKALTNALSLDPDILILDEPTNHLDFDNKKALSRLLKNFNGTLIIASHDVELLRSSIDTFWHIDNSKIMIFSGDYDDYIREIYCKRQTATKELSRLEREKKDMHQALMQEQHRAAKSKNKGQKSIDNKKWPTITSKTKALNAQETSGRKKVAIENKKQYLLEELQNARLPEVILPKFSLSYADTNKSCVLSIANGSIGYANDILKNINITLMPSEKLAITGKNGSGKSTIIKGILNDSKIFRNGSWYVTKEIGYLDQHYDNLEFDKTVFQNIANTAPNWKSQEIRRHLNDFLFRKNEEVNSIVQNLSGGEKVRLSLALIAAKTPRLLILDEITNNLDLETKQHVTQVLKKFPGAILVISHDECFLKEIGISEYFAIENNSLFLKS